MLPVVGEDSERCDAARNRRLLLDAATELVATLGADAVTMEAVATRAGVGKGTVFRRFGNRAGLMRALLDHTEKMLQSSFMFGEPPLGPGADPIDRLVAFVSSDAHFSFAKGAAVEDALPVLIPMAVFL